MKYGSFKPTYEVFMFEKKVLQNHLREVFQKEYPQLAAISTLVLDYAGGNRENRRIRCQLKSEQEIELYVLLEEIGFLYPIDKELNEYLLAEKLLHHLFGEKATGFFDEVDFEYAVYKPL